MKRYTTARQKSATSFSLIPRSSSVLQRRCACKGNPEQDEETQGVLQCKAANLAPSRPVPPLVHDVLRSPGQLLDPATRAFMEPRFGHDFGAVRVHTDIRAGKSAEAVNALAYTIGRDIVFGPSQYSPGSEIGSRLLAHELAHIVQQQTSNIAPHTLIGKSGDRAEQEADKIAETITDKNRCISEHPIICSQPSAVIQRLEIEPAVDLGSAKTTAPIATISPQRQMNETLDRELVLITKASLLIPWITAHTRFTFDELFADSSTIAKLDVSKDIALRSMILPFPRQEPPKHTEQLFTKKETIDEFLQPPKDKYELWPIIDLLQYYGVILLKPGSDPFGNPSVEATLNHTGFVQQTNAIKAFAENFKKSIANRRKRDAANRIAHRNVTETGEIPEKWGQRIIEGPERTFSKSVVTLLERLRKKNDKWKASNYTPHYWHEFSVDMYLGQVGINRIGGFYLSAGVKKFFQDLNEACEDDSPPGKFAWRAIYNDKKLASEINVLYGAGRVLSGVPGHGPGPDMHIHLDLRPLNIQLGKEAGFYLDENRVVLTPPAPHPSVPPPPPPLPSRI
jgi:hypothetical protein